MELIKGKRGVIFMFDVFMATALAILFITVFMSIKDPRENIVSDLILSRTANDFLVSGEEAEIFETKDNDIISSYINNTLPSSFNIDFNMKIYNRSLEISDEINISRSFDSSQEEFVTARRIIPIYESTNLTEIGLITFKLGRGDIVG